MLVCSGKKVLGVSSIRHLLLSKYRLAEGFLFHTRTVWLPTDCWASHYTRRGSLLQGFLWIDLIFFHKSEESLCLSRAKTVRYPISSQSGSGAGTLRQVPGIATEIAYCIPRRNLLLDTKEPVRSMQRVFVI